MPSTHNCELRHSTKLMMEMFPLLVVHTLSSVYIFVVPFRCEVAQFLIAAAEFLVLLLFQHGGLRRSNQINLPPVKIKLEKKIKKKKIKKKIKKKKKKKNKKKKKKKLIAN